MSKSYFMQKKLLRVVCETANKDEDIEEETTKVVQQVQQLNYITNVNGSVIIRLG